VLFRSEVLVIAAALEVQEPRDRPHEKEADADYAHAQFEDDHSDFISYLNLWAWYGERRKSLSRGKLHKACKQNFLSYFRMREWHEVRNQLDRLCTEAGFTKNHAPATHDSIHRALLAGLLTFVGKKGEKYEYEGTRETRYTIFPGSGLFSVKPKWIMSAELVETGRLYARTVAKIDPSWILHLGEHMLKRTNTDPTWDRERGYVTANQRITIRGLEIVPKRVVNFASVDPEQARSIFIHRALVEGDSDEQPPFLAHNIALVEHVRDLEHRARRSDLLADNAARYEFYDVKLPADVHSFATLNNWRKREEKDNPRALYMREEDLLAADPAEVTEELYPDALAVDATELPVAYSHAPGKEDDGLTVTIPIAALNQAATADFDRLVPGHLREKVTELIRSLPKRLRRSFAPATDFADKALLSIDPKTRTLFADLALALSSIAGVEVRASDFDASSLPEHLRMRYRVVDEQGEELVAGRDLSTIKSELKPRLETTIASLEHERFRREGITAWEIGRAHV